MIVTCPHCQADLGDIEAMRRMLTPGLKKFPGTCGTCGIISFIDTETGKSWMAGEKELLELPAWALAQLVMVAKAVHDRNVEADTQEKN